MYNDHNMLHGNGDYFFGGIHMFWWILLLIVIFAILFWVFRFRKRE
jgi:LPXTG-motif cell wall-anchored protein